MTHRHRQAHRRALEGRERRRRRRMRAWLRETVMRWGGAVPDEPAADQACGKLPEDVERRIVDRLRSGWTGTITLDVKDGRVRKIAMTEHERLSA